MEGLADPGIPHEELDLEQQQHMLNQFRQDKSDRDLPVEKDSGFDWHSQCLNGDKRFSCKRQQEELNRIEAGKFEDIPEQHAILESFKEPPKFASTPSNRRVDQDLREQLAAMQKQIRELEKENCSVKKAVVVDNVKNKLTPNEEISNGKVEAARRSFLTRKLVPVQVKNTTEPVLKLRSGDIPGANTAEMIRSISAKLGKGPIPEWSDSIPICPIHQVPVQSTIGKAMEDLGNVSFKGEATGNPGDPDGDSSSLDSDLSSGSASSSKKSNSKKKRSRSSNKKKKSINRLQVKPIEPEKYDGSADPMKYSRHL